MNMASHEEMPEPSTIAFCYGAVVVAAAFIYAAVTNAPPKEALTRTEWNDWG
jgi:hypothetical protein